LCISLTTTANSSSALTGEVTTQHVPVFVEEQQTAVLISQQTLRVLPHDEQLFLIRVNHWGGLFFLSFDNLGMWDFKVLWEIVTDIWAIKNEWFSINKF
jgi:hypothetical protein